MIQVIVVLSKSIPDKYSLEKLSAMITSHLVDLLQARTDDSKEERADLHPDELEEQLQLFIDGCAPELDVTVDVTEEVIEVRVFPTVRVSAYLH